MPLSPDQQSAYVMAEWDQAWAHSRHLETTRGQYLGLFFTAVLGVLAIAGPRLADDSLRSPASLLILAALVLGLQILTAFLYLAVIRINAVLHHYMQIIFAIRDEMIPASKGIVDLAAVSRPPDPVPPWAGTSKIAKNVLRLGLFAFPIVLGGAVIRSIEALGSVTTTYFCAIALLLCFLVGLRVRFGALVKDDGAYY